MLGTRSKSRTEGDLAAAIVTTTSATLTTNAATTSVTNTGAIPKQVDTNQELSQPLGENVLESSAGSVSANSTVITPPFSSVSAQGVIDAFRQNKETLRPQGKYNQFGMGNARRRNVTQEDLRNFEDRLLNIVPRLIQQSFEAQAQRNESGTRYQGSNAPLPNLGQPPPPRLSVPTPQLQIQPWPNTNFCSTSTGSNSNGHHRQDIPGLAAEHRNGQRTVSTGLRIDKWGINFDGTSKTTSIEDFVFRVEVLQSDYGCEWREVIKSFHHLLSGTAREWFWDHRRFNQVSRWTDFKAALIAQFHRYDSDFDIQRKILDRRQNNNETFEEFYNSVIRLRNQLRSPLGEQDLVTVMKGNLKAAMAQLLFSVQVHSLAQFAKECRRAENLLNSQRQISNRYSPRAIHSIESDIPEEEDVLQVDAIAATKKLQCWNCKAEGHTFFDCWEEQRNLFCYKCGLEGTVTPRCTNCQGNRVANGIRQGIETRSKGPHRKQQNRQSQQ